MTQQPYYPQPGYPAQQQFPGQAPQQPYAPQQYAPPAQPFQQPFQPPAQQPQAPAQPLAQGTLDDFYNQPTTGGGPSISWKDKPIGTTYVGVVARDVTQGDVQQQVNFQSKQPEFYRDGRPKFVLKVPLKQLMVLDLNTGQAFPAPEFAENGGEGSFYVRGQARDELARAQAEANVSGAPKAGDVIQVSLVQRKPSGQGMNPSNVVQIRYTPGQSSASTAPAHTEAVSSATDPGQTLPVQQPQTPAPSYAAPGQQFQPQGIQQPHPPQASAQQMAPQPPAGLSPEQQELLAKLTGGQQGAPAA